MQRITPCLWFNDNAEEAVNHYISIFENSKIDHISRYGESGYGEPGSVLLITFELEGQQFQAVNGHQDAPDSHNISLSVSVETQEELDEMWGRLSADPESEQCGWLKDKYGFSWQIVPRILGELMESGTPEQSERVMKAVLGMKKLDIAELKQAFEG